MVSKPASHAAEREFSLMTIGIDIGKDSMHIVGFDAGGRIVLRRKFRRLSLEAEFQKLPRCIAGHGSLPQRPLYQPAAAYPWL